MLVAGPRKKISPVLVLQHQTLVSELFCFLTGHVIQCMLPARLHLLCEEDMVLGSWSFHGWLVQALQLF